MNTENRVGVTADLTLMNLFEGLHFQDLEFGKTVESICESFQKSLEDLKTQGETFGKGCSQLFTRSISLEGRQDESERLQRENEKAIDEKIAVLRDRVVFLEANVADLLAQLNELETVDEPLTQLQRDRLQLTDSLREFVLATASVSSGIDKSVTELKNSSNIKNPVEGCSRSLNDLNGYNESLKRDARALANRFNGHAHPFTTVFNKKSYGSLTNGPTNSITF